MVLRSWFAKLVVMALSFSAQAEDVFDIAEKYHEKSNEVVNLEVQRRLIMGEIYGIERETQKMVLQKAELDEKRVQLDYDLTRISAHIVSLERELADLTPQLNDRVAFFEQVNDLPWFYAFLTAQSLEDLDQLYQTAQDLNKKQADQFVNYIGRHHQLKQEREELTKTATEIVHLKKEISKQEGKIESNQNNKSKMLKKLERKIASEKTSLRSLKGRGKRALVSSEFQNLDLLFGTQFFEKKSELPHPIDGKIIQGFGLNRGLGFDAIELVHKGNFYEGFADQEVQTVAEGRVNFVGQVPGYGWTIIIDHGGRYYSVYGNLKKSFVKNKMVVKSKQKIGTIGHMHLQYNVGLYFEIRHFSEPQNPETWLMPQESHLATL